MTATPEPAGTRLGGLHTRTWGPMPAAGAPLLLVHGLTDDGGCWPDAVARWSHRTVHAVDLPGHGRSPRLVGADLDDPMPACAAAVGRALADVAALHGRPAVAVGHSMGAGALAIAVADGAPAAALVLEDPRVAHETTPVRVRMGRMRAREVRAWHDDPEGQLAVLRAACPTWSDAEVRASAAARPLADPALLATGRAGLVGGDDLQVRVVTAAAARVPTLLVTGDRPGAIWSPALLDALDGVPARVVPGGGHTVRREAPAGYHEVVDAVLAAHP